MSKPTFRIPGPVGRDHSRVGPGELVDRHVMGGNGSVSGGFSRGLVSTSTGPNGRAHHGKPAFPHIPRDQLYISARVRMEDPSKIDQTVASLCGPAALMFLVAKNWPALYYQFVLDLYEFGAAKLNRLQITPSKGCRNFDPFGKISAADWVALAGLRDSENAILQYSDVSDTASGITLPSTLAGWLERAGFKNVYNETNLYLTKGEKNLRDAAKLRREGAEVCLLINGRGIDKKPSDRGILRQAVTTANHWVVLTSDIAFDERDDTIRFTVFTWGNRTWQVPYRGEGKQQNPNQKMTMRQWLQNYYGYVACKP
jgi:hypothetical protein